MGVMPLLLISKFIYSATHCCVTRHERVKASHVESLNINVLETGTFYQPQENLPSVLSGARVCQQTIFSIERVPLH